MLIDLFTKVNKFILADYWLIVKNRADLIQYRL
jgi:hypothetical protein